MPDILKSVIGDVIWGFRDSILGSVKVIKYRESQPKEQSPKQQRDPARSSSRRRESSKQNSEPSILNRISQCSLWNGGIFLFSILLFKGVFTLVFGHDESDVFVWYWTGVILTWVFSTFWILPLFILSKVINCFWFQDIADAAYMKSHGKPRLPNLSLLIADVAFSITVQIVFLLQASLFTYLPIPVIGHFISLFHLSLLYSLYAFEYKWFNMGMGVQSRLSAMETNWPYYVGFGLPLTVMTSLPSSALIGGCIFSTIFPFFIISANEAVEPTRSFNIPIKMFTPVVSLVNVLIRHSHKRIHTGQKQSLAHKSPRKSMADR